MLGKLIKYELKSTGRLFLPFYAAVLVLSILNRVLFVALDNMKFMEIPRFITMSTYVVLIIGTFVMTYVVMMQRFYKNLLGEEGYLSMTLPVTATQHIISKSITAFIWIVSTVIVTFISIFAMLPDYSFINEIISGYSTAAAGFAAFANISLTAFILIMLLASLISLLASIFMIYTAISFGQLANKHRVMMSFVSYIGIYAVVQTINVSLIGILGSGYNDWLNKMTRSIEHANESDMIVSMPGYVIPVFIGGMIILQLIYCAAYFFITKYVLEKKLNLE